MNRRIRKRRKNSIDNLPVNTSISILCGVANLIIIGIMCYRATSTNGKLGIITGLVGVLAIIVGGNGIYYAFKGVREDDNNYFTIPLVAIIVNILLTVFLVVLYIIGIFVR